MICEVIVSCVFSAIGLRLFPLFVACSLTGCAAISAKPIIDAADKTKSCPQLNHEAGQLAMQAAQQSAVVRAMKERNNTFTILSYVPIVGGVAGVADLVGDASGSRAGAKAQEDRDWASARSAYLRDLAAEHCPPLQTTSAPGPRGEPRSGLGNRVRAFTAVSKWLCLKDDVAAVGLP